MENVNWIAQPACQSHFINVEFNYRGEILDSLLHNQSHAEENISHILPKDYREIVIKILNNQCIHYNVKSEYQGQFWQWSFHFREENVCAYAIDITDSVRKENLLIQHRNIMESFRQQESTLFFRRLAHDFRSPVSAIISGLGILVSALSIEDLSDEKILIDEMNKECKRFYDDIGIKLNTTLMQQLKTTVNKSLVDINALLIASEKYSSQLTEYFDISYHFTPSGELPQFYCDLEKFSLALYQMLLFLAQEYVDSTVCITAEHIESHLVFRFNVQNVPDKQQHQCFIDNYSGSSSDVEIIPNKILHEICELISLNQGEVAIENLSSINNNEGSWLFTFELN